MTIMQRRRLGMQLLIGFLSPFVSVPLSEVFDTPFLLTQIAVFCSLGWAYEMRHTSKLTFALDIARREHERERTTVLARLKEQAEAGGRIVAKVDAMMANVEARIGQVDAMGERFDAAHGQAVGQLTRLSEEIEQVEKTFKLSSLDPPKKPKPLPS